MIFTYASKLNEHSVSKTIARINCYSDLENFENSEPSASNFKSFSRSLEQFFLTVGQNNFGNKIPFLTFALSNILVQLLHFLKSIEGKISKAKFKVQDT